MMWRQYITPARGRRRFSPPPAAESWVRSGALWECAACGKQYPKRGQVHSCVLVPLEHHFAERPLAGELFDAYHAAIKEAGGPVRLSVAKTRIGFITGITFAAVYPRKRYLRAGFLLLHRLKSPRFVKVERHPPWWAHTLEIRDVSDIDDELKAWLREAYGISGRTRGRGPP